MLAKVTTQNVERSCSLPNLLNDPTWFQNMLPSRNICQLCVPASCDFLTSLRREVGWEVGWPFVLEVEGVAEVGISDNLKTQKTLQVKFQASRASV